VSPRYERSPGGGGGGGGGKRRRNRAEEWDIQGHESPAKRRKSRDRSKERRKEEKKKKKDKDRDRDRNRSGSPSSRKRRRSPRSPASSVDSPRYTKSSSFGTPATTLEEDLAKAKSMVKRESNIHDTSLFAEMLKKKQLREKLALNRSRKEGEAAGGGAAPHTPGAAALRGTDTVDEAAHRAGPPPLPPGEQRNNRRSGQQQHHQAPLPPLPEADQRPLATLNGAKYRKGEQLQQHQHEKLLLQEAEHNLRPRNSTPRPSKLPGPPGQCSLNFKIVCPGAYVSLAGVRAKGGGGGGASLCFWYLFHVINVIAA
jgi:hypothetical protein